MLDVNQQNGAAAAMAAFLALTPAQQAALLVQLQAQALAGLNTLRAAEGLAPLASLPL